VNINNTTPITSVYSPSFPVTTLRTDENNVTATYISTKSRPNRDFDLYYKLSDEDVSFHLFTHKKENEDGYFLMLLTPKLKKPDEGDPVVAKDIVFTIDKSGSMGGVKITQARDALRFCINRLLPDDYFNIVAFQSTLSSNAAQLLPATAENIGSTREFVDEITAGGGTNIAEALTTSLSRMGPTGRPHYCIFLTDGQATSGVTDMTEIIQMVKEANTGGTRIFSVGFGFNVNTILIDKISIDNGGFPLYCNPDQNIEEVISDLYKKIESPLITSPKLSFDGAVSLNSISPEKLPDLFSGSEIAVYGRYKGHGINTVTLSGNNGKKAVSLNYTAKFPASNDIYPFIPRLWATQQIAGLMTKIKLQALTKENSTSLVDSIKKLSLEYGIITPYTSSLFIKGGAPGTVVDGLQRETGSSANSASNYMQSMRQNSNSAQTVVADTNSLSYNVAPKINQIQNVDNKIFVYTPDSLWKDAAYDSGNTADTVLYGSERYFTIAANNPELRKLLTVGNQAMFTYNDKNYIVLDHSRSTKVIMAKKTKSNIFVKSQNLVINVKKSLLTIFRSRSELPGTVKIYSFNGRHIAHLHFKKSRNLIYLAKCEHFGSGAYLLVYRERGLELVKRIVLK
ncbi:MAG: VWA domain-containing protein, partial [Chitinispirillia bacterium]